MARSAPVGDSTRSLHRRYGGRVRAGVRQTRADFELGVRHHSANVGAHPILSAPRRHASAVASTSADNTSRPGQRRHEHRRRPMTRRRRGFALLSAIWLLVALSTLALEMSVIARHRRLAVANTLEAVRAERAAASGIEQERADLGRLLVQSAAGKAWN